MFFRILMSQIQPARTRTPTTSTKTAQMREVHLEEPEDARKDFIK
jgi:hypothetical protein